MIFIYLLFFNEILVVLLKLSELQESVEGYMTYYTFPFHVAITAGIMHKGEKCSLTC